MSWRYKIVAEGAATTITARDLTGRRHIAVVVDADPPVLTHFGEGPHNPCRMAEALELSECLIAAPNPILPARDEISVRREAAVDAPLNWRTRLQAAAELDRLSGVVADEIAALGVSPGEIGLAPILRLRMTGDAKSVSVWLATEGEMRAALSAERLRSGVAPLDTPVMIEAMAITAYGPGDAREPTSPTIRSDPPYLDPEVGPVAGPGVLVASGRDFTIERGWIVSPAPDAVARLRKSAKLA